MTALVWRSSILGKETRTAWRSRAAVGCGILAFMVAYRRIQFNCLDSWAHALSFAPSSASTANINEEVRVLRQQVDNLQKRYVNNGAGRLIPRHRFTPLCKPVQVLAYVLGANVAVSREVLAGRDHGR